MSIGDPVQRCDGCGAGLTLDDLRGADCPFCKRVLPHRAQAQQGAALVTELMVDTNRDGIPDAFEDLARNASAAYGVPITGTGVAWSATGTNEAVRTATKVATGMIILSLVITLVVVAIVVGAMVLAF